MITEETIRIQKFLSQAGIMSRRKAEKLIAVSSIIEVNGRPATIGQMINPNTDRITIKGKKIKVKTDKVYLALNKPEGYICSISAQQGKTVLDLISPKEQKKYGHFYPVGRLDKDSCGLIILTSDGDITQKVTHPKYAHEKEYLLTTNRRLEEKDKLRLCNKMKLGKDIVQGIKIKAIKKQGTNFIIRIVIKEGKNRQLRRMFLSLNYPILRLKRVRVGKVNLGNIKEGRYIQIDGKKIL